MKKTPRKGFSCVGIPYFTYFFFEPIQSEPPSFNFEEASTVLGSEEERAVIPKYPREVKEFGKGKLQKPLRISKSSVKSFEHRGVSKLIVRPSILMPAERNVDEATILLEAPEWNRGKE